MALEICKVCLGRPATHVAFRMHGTVSFTCCDECDTKGQYADRAGVIKRGDTGWLRGFPVVVVSADEAECGEIVMMPR